MWDTSHGWFQQVIQIRRLRDIMIYPLGPRKPSIEAFLYEIYTKFIAEHLQLNNLFEWRMNMTYVVRGLSSPSDSSRGRQLKWG